MTQSKYEELYHHGIKGQKWGVRRFQNEDGSLTTAGRKRYSEGEKKQIDKEKLIKIGAAITTTALVTCGGYYLYKSGKINNLINIGKTTVKHVGSISEIDSILPKTDKYQNFQEAYKNINPNHPLKLKDTDFTMLSKIDSAPLATVNCQACTFVYELRRRGYDVLAKLVDTREFDINELYRKLYKDISNKNIKKYFSKRLVLS